MCRKTDDCIAIQSPELLLAEVIVGQVPVGEVRPAQRARGLSQVAPREVEGDGRRALPVRVHSVDKRRVAYNRYNW